MAEPSLTRRRLIAALGVGGLAAGALLFAWRPAGFGGRDTLADRLAAALRAWAADAPAPAGAGTLPRDEAAALLVAGLSDHEIDALCEDPARLRAHVSARVREDLAAGRTTFADGWLVARTELAVASLEAPASAG